MPPDSRSASFVFHRDTLNVDDRPNHSRGRSFRRRLQDRFNEDTSSSARNSPENKNGSDNKNCSGSGRSWHNMSFGSVTSDSRKVLQNGAEKISRTFSNVRVTLGNISQRFKLPTRRRHRLEEQFTPDNSASKNATPQTRSRHLLGRTPTKLYSPFGIESPWRDWGKENDPNESKDSGRGFMKNKQSKKSKQKRLFNINKFGGFRNLR